MRKTNFLQKYFLSLDSAESHESDVEQVPEVTTESAESHQIEAPVLNDTETEDSHLGKWISTTSE